MSNGKIVIAGANGFIGTELIDQCLKHMFIKHIYCLVRHELPTKYSTHAKITQVQHDDFNDLPDHLFERFKGWGVGACIWCVGNPKIASYKNLEEAQKVGIQYPIQAAEKFAKFCAPEYMETQTGKNIVPFRFIFMSIWGAERNQFKSLWIWNDSRKIKGAAEKGLFDIMESCQVIDNKRCLEVTAMRAGAFIKGGDGVGTIVAMGAAPCIAVDRLARSTIKLCLDGDSEKKRVWENNDCLGEDWAMVNKFVFS